MPSYVGDNLAVANYLGNKLVCGEDLLTFRALQAGVNGEWKAIHAAAVGTNVYSARDTVATVIDHEGLVREVPDYTIRPQNARIVENLADGNETQNITVVSGGKYWVSVEAGETGSVVCSDAFTGAITGSAANRKTWSDDTVRTATSTTLTLTVSGTITGLFVEDVTGSSVQDAPSEYVSSIPTLLYPGAVTLGIEQATFDATIVLSGGAPSYSWQMSDGTSIANDLTPSHSFSPDKGKNAVALMGVDVAPYVTTFICDSQSGWGELNLSLLTALTAAHFYTNSFTGFTGTVSSTITSGLFQNNLLTQTAVDNCLVAFDNAGGTNGVLDLGGNTAPSATGDAAKISLEGKGWTVTVD